MSVHVTTNLQTRPECTEQAIDKVRGVLEESRQRRDQDDPAHIVSFTRWARRQDYEDELAWRTEAGCRGGMNELLNEPQTFAFSDDIVSLTR
jgi:hypothetical protein